MSLTKNLEFEKTSFLTKSNSAFLEQMYLKYINKDLDLPSSWKNYFDDLGDELDLVVNEIKGPSWAPIKKQINIVEKKPKKEVHSNGSVKNVISENNLQNNIDSIKAVELIRAYRLRGHLLARLDPLGLKKTEYLEELHPEYYGFKKSDYKREIFLNGVTNKKYSNINEILTFLNNTYCGPIGYEYMHISNPEERIWLRRRIEEDENEIKFTKNGKEAILNKLIQAEGFEKFLATKYVGTKRFGLDGAESLIPALEQIIKIGGQSQIKEVKIGMSHRGRLNVLANVLQKSYKRIFNEFGGEFNSSSNEGAGDVKYHLGASSNREFDGNPVHVSLTDNPSPFGGGKSCCFRSNKSKTIFS
jgi:2-oxoglutarate dehydrogenase E1 component